MGGSERQGGVWASHLAALTSPGSLEPEVCLPLFGEITVQFVLYDK